MEGEKIRIQMLGRFSIGMGEAELDDQGNRSRKVWLLLAYMICCRDRAVSQEELIRLLWGEEGSANPQNALKTMFHRLRQLLDQLGPDQGHRLIIRSEGSYAWNPETPIDFDAENFDALCRAAERESDEELRVEQYLQAVSLFHGDFLSRFATDLWVVPMAAYYHNLYLQVVQELLHRLEERERKREAADLCHQALEVEPYQEQLYVHLMRNLLDLGEQEEAARAYEDMSELLYENFGVKPSEELRSLYRAAIRTNNDQAVSIEEVLEQMQETNSVSGALLCEYDFFRVLYHAEARSIARNGDAVHLALLSLHSGDDKPMAKRNLECAMENLQTVARRSLRRGDVVAKCSVSQYILMLPQANYENSCMVCERIIRAFYRQFPHSPAELQYQIKPIEPDGSR